MTMRWTHLLSTRRAGQDQIESVEPFRSPFAVDSDRITFSRAFRGLAGKMQVHGPGRLVGVRTRLTHSLEVSSIGRSLGTLAGRQIVQSLPDTLGIEPHDIGEIVAVAAKSHDIGSIPFAHPGERFVSRWFATTDLGKCLTYPLTGPLAAEFETLEGNAFGFRQLVHLDGWRPQGGLQLTAAVLGAFTKYPWSIRHKTAKGKYGFLLSEVPDFRQVAEATGLIQTDNEKWVRHPLAYLVEAADDISYLIVDLEDAVHMGVIDFSDAADLLLPIAKPDMTLYRQLANDDRRLICLRSKAIGRLVEAASRAFATHETAIMNGRFAGDLLSATPEADALSAIRQMSDARIYHSVSRLETDRIAEQAIVTLLEAWMRPYETVAKTCRSEQQIVDLATTLRIQVDRLAAMTDDEVLASAATISKPKAARRRAMPVLTPRGHGVLTDTPRLKPPAALIAGRVES